MATVAGTKTVAVVGGGIQGLSLTYFLSKRGYRVSLFERGKNLGGLLGILKVSGTPLEGFYHHWFTSHADILDLVRELGLSDRLLYLPSRVGTFWDGKIFPFTTPRDLLAFTPLHFIDRLRLGAAALFLRLQKEWRGFENVRASEWLQRYAGKRAWEIVWKPLLAGKFGAAAEEVSMAWVWGRIHERITSRGGSGSAETLVYPRGGFKKIIDRIVEETEKAGGTVETGVSVDRISRQGDRLEISLGGTRREVFDRVFVTTPVNVFSSLVKDLPESYKDKLASIRYRGAHCSVLVLSKPLLPDRYYWVNVADRSVPLLAVIEHTNLLPSEDYGGKTVVYLGNYPDPSDPLMKLDREDVLDFYAPHLSKFNPAFRKEWIEEFFMFKDPAAQPIVDTHYRDVIPPLETPVPGLYLVTMAQIYPFDRGTSNAVRQAKEAVETLGL